MSTLSKLISLQNPTSVMSRMGVIVHLCVGLPIFDVFIATVGPPS